MLVYFFIVFGGIFLGVLGIGGFWVLRCRRRGVRVLEVVFLGMYIKGRDGEEK